MSKKIWLHRYHVCCQIGTITGEMGIDAKKKIITDEQLNEVRFLFKQKMNTETTPAITSLMYLGKEKKEWKQK